jgi:hypothetical protein
MKIIKVQSKTYRNNIIEYKHAQINHNKEQTHYVIKFFTTHRKYLDDFDIDTSNFEESLCDLKCTWGLTNCNKQDCDCPIVNCLNFKIKNKRTWHWFRMVGENENDQIFFDKIVVANQGKWNDDRHEIIYKVEPLKGEYAIHIYLYPTDEQHLTEQASISYEQYWEHLSNKIEKADLKTKKIYY